PAWVRGCSRVYDVWSSGARRELEVVGIARDDVEGPARSHFYDGGKGPVAEQLARETVTGDSARLIDAAEYEPVALIEQGIRAFGAGGEAILRGQRRSQNGGVCA